MTEYTKAIFNADTEEIIYADFTPEELEAHKIRQAEFLAEQKALAAERLAKESALAKLEALGLTPDEIAAITGA